MEKLIEALRKILLLAGIHEQKRGKGKEDFLF